MEFLTKKYFLKFIEYFVVLIGCKVQRLFVYEWIYQLAISLFYEIQAYNFKSCTYTIISCKLEFKIF